jgi:TRAP-type mannitol/chloroaromatic compound transport system substrate-binding protein
VKKLLTTIAAATAILTSGLSHAADPTVRWKMAGMFGSSFKPIGQHIIAMTKKAEQASGGSLKIRFYEPGALVPVAGIFDAVSAGSIEAGYAGIGFYTNKEPGIALYNAAPFTPDLAEFMAWIYYGGGQQVLDEVLKPHKIKAIFCGVLAPEAGGWFRKEVNTLADLKGLKMRIGGLGANVMEKVGVSTQVLGGADVFPALERGVIDAAEYSNPGVDESLGFDQAAKYYYFPGWQNPTSPEWLIVNTDAYAKLTPSQKSALDMACGDTVARSIAEGEVVSMQALKRIKDKGVNIRRWKPEVVTELRRLWNAEAERLSAENANFKKIWTSMSNFRKEFAVWRDLQRLE